ncbi:MAG: hypothetical protein ACRDYE_11565, partial [Acidimicrobiales bacterium]
MNTFLPADGEGTGGRRLSAQSAAKTPDRRAETLWSSRPQPRSKTAIMLAYTYPLLSIFWTMLEFFLFFLW